MITTMTPILYELYLIFLSPRSWTLQINDQPQVHVTCLSSVSSCICLVSPSVTSRPRLSLLLLLLLLLLWHFFSSTNISSTKLEVLFSSSSSSDPEELHTSMVTGEKRLPAVFLINRLNPSFFRFYCVFAALWHTSCVCAIILLARVSGINTIFWPTWVGVYTCVCVCVCVSVQENVSCLLGVNI